MSGLRGDPPEAVRGARTPTGADATLPLLADRR